MKKQLGMITSLLFLSVSTLLWTGCNRNRCCEPCEPVCEPCRPVCPVPCRPVCPPKPCKPVCPEPCKPAVCPEPCRPVVCQEPCRPSYAAPCAPVCQKPCRPVQPCCQQPERPVASSCNQEFFQSQRPYDGGFQGNDPEFSQMNDSQDFDYSTPDQEPRPNIQY